MVTYTGVFLPASPTVPGALEGELFGRVGMSLAGVPESNLRETMSAMLYFCTDEPTWKVISLPVPPKNLPSIRLPFFSAKESAHAIDAARQNPITNPQFSLNFMMTSPLPRSAFGKPPTLCMRDVYENRSLCHTYK